MNIPSPPIIKFPRKIFVISDLHMGHENILKFTDDHGNNYRTFDNVAQMDECIIDSWNSVVSQGDIVYNLGDVFFGDKEKFVKNHVKLKGSKRLIVGNHDDIRYLSSGSFFKKVMLERWFKEFGIGLSHRPMRDEELVKGNMECLNVHGHVHLRTLQSTKHKNVSAEVVNYTPIELGSLSIF